MSADPAGLNLVTKAEGCAELTIEGWKELGVVGQIKRGDIDRIVIRSTNDMLFKVLEDMSKDKLVKLCWDAENEDFIWVLRQPNEPDKIETQYKAPKKRINKKTK